MDKKDDTADSTKKREWPNKVRSRGELDSALDAGLKSGVSNRTTEEIFESVIDRLKNG